MATTEVQWSELQRDPKAVAALADAGDVHVRRRDGVPLLLTRADRAATNTEGVVFAARMMRNALAHLAPEAVAQALVEEFPWAAYFPDDVRVEFANDISKTLQAAAELGQWSVFTQAIIEWRSTAYVYSDPDLLAKLRGPFREQDFITLPPPVEVEDARKTE